MNTYIAHKSDLPLSFEVSSRKGFTIVEITVVLAVLLTLLAIGIGSYRGYSDWKKGQDAGLKLRQVYTAQRTYLAEHPTEKVDDLTDAKLIPYLSNGAAALPTIEDLDGNTLSIKVDKSPPYIEGNYDPSGKSDDGQWDLGE